MGMKTLLRRCNELYQELDCCHGSNNDCWCGKCWEEDFYTNRADSYDCLKKLCFYTMNYGPAYASEIYHYLNASKILEREFNGRIINVLSLGCGFSPDAYALEKYIYDNDLDIEFYYTGIDIEENWKEIREDTDNKNYILCDLIEGFTLNDYDIIFIGKAFSTIRRNNVNNSNVFLRLLIDEIDTMVEGSFLIFVDINHYKFGRDVFDSAVRDLFIECNYYYFPVEKSYSGNYIRINNTFNVFDYPDDLIITPKPTVFSTIIFEYRK